jgi:hypothetical protein
MDVLRYIEQWLSVHTLDVLRLLLDRLVGVLGLEEVDSSP